ncbi:MAG: desulfoferrodoxin FeS4 iron-binding domain-containing protein [Bacilli bacterium]|jgi:superoxide reductase|nr:desulfoferrodoxin FeS4 iron-binding domain-containing protein [Bacilli bacterium]MCH4277947.1 desulfoferrodoxin FeS4 iron-binding domain-containing protein [Bacilli bacterium]
MEEVEFYRCERCGNVVALLHKGGGTLVCCGKEMDKLVAKSGDTGMEKHVPVISHENGKLVAKCGSIPHPMSAVHYIEWFALVNDGEVKFVYLPHEGVEAKAEFPDVEHGTVYAFCNIHGLWKTEF